MTPETGAAICEETTMDPARIAAQQTGSTPGRRPNYTTPWATTIEKWPRCIQSIIATSRLIYRLKL
jgi:hypothetical protein